MFRLLQFLLLISITIFIYATISLCIPWYSMQYPIFVTEKVYHPGDKVELYLNRSALINIAGKVTRELIRIDGAEEYEVLTISVDTDIERGVKRKTLYFKLPTQKECPQLIDGDYIWSGNVRYSPFGLFHRSEHFKTKIFKIKNTVVD